MGDIRIGTSGWRYPPWRKVFYPDGLPQRRELEYLASRLNSVEINGTFYSLQKPSSFTSWVAETPDDVTFAVKGPRFVTHMKKLRDVQTPLANFFASGVLALGAKLEPMLWQLPPNLGYDADRLAEFFALLPRTTDAAASLAKQHDERDDRPRADRGRHFEADPPRFGDAAQEFRNIGLPRAAEASRHRPRHRRHRRTLAEKFDVATSELVYVRLHGDIELYTSGYTDTALAEWAGRIRAWSRDHDVRVHFDNDVKVRAPFDAMALTERLSGSRPR